ncbi:hypothetical protein JCGZ_08896 [Jatropha curcas]|uniref:Aminotransferase-like plant mobile domain-containing protein n=1 Tax=Jatropha curcas TaxID=180498 RepID=A0A067KNB9_JATCU|nr:hypothetical protein JCGZ_08896 [Jatropha curcas]
MVAGFRDPVVSWRVFGEALRGRIIFSSYRSWNYSPIFDWKEKFNPSILKSLENLALLKEYDWAGAILSRMYDDMCDLSRGHGKLSGTFYFWETWAFEYFPYTRPELLQTNPRSELAPSAWRWYKSNLHPIRHNKSLKELRAFFDTCALGQVYA